MAAEVYGRRGEPQMKFNTFIKGTASNTYVINLLTWL